MRNDRKSPAKMYNPEGVKRHWVWVWVCVSALGRGSTLKRAEREEKTGFFNPHTHRQTLSLQHSAPHRDLSPKRTLIWILQLTQVISYSKKSQVNHGPEGNDHPLRELAPGPGCGRGKVRNERHDLVVQVSRGSSHQALGCSSGRKLRLSQDQPGDDGRDPRVCQGEGRLHHPDGNKVRVWNNCSLSKMDPECVFVLYSRQVNDSIMELLIMCYACKSSSCKRVIGVIPYMPYSRQSK